MSGFARPEESEYNAYYRHYVASVPDGDVFSFLHSQAAEVASRMYNVLPEQEEHRYAEGKWSVRQVLGHMCDTERIFSYRLLCMARGDTASLPGMDQDVFMNGSRFEDRSLEAIADEYATIRAATISLVESLDPEDADRSGLASGFPFTVRALLWIIAGHTQHHLNVLEERYGV